MRLIFLFSLVVGISAVIPARKKSTISVIHLPPKPTGKNQQEPFLSSLDRQLPAGEICPAALRFALEKGVGPASLCMCGGREAHHHTDIDDAASGHKRKRKPLPVRSVIPKKKKDEKEDL